MPHYSRRPKSNRRKQFARVSAAAYVKPDSGTTTVVMKSADGTRATATARVDLGTVKTTLRDFSRAASTTKMRVLAEVRTDHASRKLMRLAYEKTGLRVNIGKWQDGHMPLIVTAIISGPNVEEILNWKFYVEYSLREEFLARPMMASGAGAKPSVKPLPRSDEQAAEERSETVRHASGERIPQKGGSSHIIRWMHKNVSFVEKSHMGYGQSVPTGLRGAQ